MSGTRRLLTRLRAMMAGGDSTDPDGPKDDSVLRQLTKLVAGELVAEVCTIYAMRPGDLLELTATFGLNQDAVGRTRLRVGEGIVGLVAATGKLKNLPDAQNHPAFAYRPETGEEPYASLLAVPVRRAGRTLGVVAVQNRDPRLYAEEECEVLETVAMLLAELLPSAGASDGAEQGLASTLPRRFAANPIAPGIAIGPVALHGMGAPLRRLLADDPAAEARRLATAAATMRQSLEELIEAGMPEGEGPRAVLEATRLVAADGGWMRRVREAIDTGLTAEAAVHRVTNEVRDRMRRIADPYLRERLADLEDLAGRLLAALDGGDGIEVPRGAILLARRLGPAQLLEWHARGIAGLLIEEGSTAGHAAILARALGLPTIGGARGALEAVEEGDDAVLDADEGQLILRPDQEVRSAYNRALQVRLVTEQGFAKQRLLPAQTACGVPLHLMLNVGLALEMEQLDATGAEGIGLFRTEIAMLARGAVADVPDQAALYARVLDAAGDRPVRFRTLDLGGDKLLPDADKQEEENPAMGWRSLRIGLDRPALLRRQLRALLLAAAGRPLSVMFPMVANVTEFRAAKSLLLAEAAKIRPGSPLAIGSMIEIPSLLFQLPELMRDADFVSIGSNDLMQFLFAADRGTPALANRYDLLSPPALDVLTSIEQAARAADVELSVCGEHAARPLEAMVLAALGITTLSMPAASLLRIKAMMAKVELGELRGLLAALRRNDHGAPPCANRSRHGRGSMGTSGRVGVERRSWVVYTSLMSFIPSAAISIQEAASYAKVFPVELEENLNQASALADPDAELLLWAEKVETYVSDLKARVSIPSTDEPILDDQLKEGFDQTIDDLLDQEKKVAHALDLLRGKGGPTRSMASGLRDRLDDVLTDWCEFLRDARWHLMGARAAARTTPAIKIDSVAALRDMLRHR